MSVEWVAGCGLQAVGYQPALERPAETIGAPNLPVTVRRGTGRPMAGKARQTVPEDDAGASSYGTREPAQAGNGNALPSQSVVFGLLDDAALVERAKTAPDAFAAVYERHVRSVFAFALSKVHDTSVAEDLTSQTFLQALRALPRYEQRGAPFKSWLFKITANLIADRHRAPRAEVPMHHHAGDGEPDEQREPADPHAEEEITAWERAEAFARLITDLTTEQRTVVQLRFVDGLPITAIAAQMARSEGAVKMLLMRALQNLRRKLAQECTDAG